MKNTKFILIGLNNYEVKIGCIFAKNPSLNFFKMLTKPKAV